MAKKKKPKTPTSTEIIPSTKLRVISVHKLWGMTCLRKYFWRWVLNLEPKGVNLNFWYGGVLGAGYEYMLLRGEYREKEVRKVLRAESKKRLAGKTTTVDDIEEMKLQMQLIEVILKHCPLNGARMIKSQLEVTYPLSPGIVFKGTLDGIGTYNKEPVTFETKTASQVTANTITALRLDKQVYGYPLALRKAGKKAPGKCLYTIFRKSQKKVKKGQSQKDFVEEIAIDLQKQPEYYYILTPLTLGPRSIAEVGKDIITGAKLLRSIYRGMTEKELLNPESWPKQDRQCLSYGICPYFQLCKNAQSYKVYMRLYKQREMLYDEERKELLT